MDTIQSTSQRREEAATWFVLLLDGNQSRLERERWKRWSAVPENRREFDATVKLWLRLRSTISPLGAATPEERAADCYDGSVPVAAWLELRRKMS